MKRRFLEEVHQLPGYKQSLTVSDMLQQPAYAMMYLLVVVLLVAKSCKKMSCLRLKSLQQVPVVFQTLDQLCDPENNSQFLL